MDINYYLKKGKKDNLQCRLTKGKENISFALGHTIDPEDWLENAEEGPEDDPYFYTLIRFKEYLETRYSELKMTGTENILAVIKTESEAITGNLGIQGIARKMFDDDNAGNNIPVYDQFIKGFEAYTGLEKSEYEVRAIDNTLEFLTDEDEEYQMDTYAGLKARLQSCVDKKSYEEIASVTNKIIWSEIYTGTGEIEKYIFLPAMLAEWELYWDSRYEEAESTHGRTEVIDRSKEKSWRQFQVFMECFDSAGDAIQLAAEIDEAELYPIAVVTMLHIYNADECYEKYCKSELENADWETIKVDGEELWIKGMED